jgi:hypothetical protein
MHTADTPARAEKLALLEVLSQLSEACFEFSRHVARDTETYNEQISFASYLASLAGLLRDRAEGKPIEVLDPTRETKPQIHEP